MENAKNKKKTKKKESKRKNKEGEDEDTERTIEKTTGKKKVTGRKKESEVGDGGYEDDSDVNTERTNERTTGKKKVTGKKKESEVGVRDDGDDSDVNAEKKKATGQKENESNQEKAERNKKRKSTKTTEKGKKRKQVTIESLLKRYIKKKDSKKDRKRKDKKKDKKKERKRQDKKKEDESHLNVLDFSYCGAAEAPSGFEQAKLSKMFFVRRFDGPQEELPINIKKANYKGILAHVGKVMNIPAIQHIRISYFLKVKGGGEKEVVLAYNKDKEVYEESLKMFYSQAQPLSTLVVKVSKPAKTRASRPIEDTFKKYFTHYAAADTRFYQEMVTASVAQQYVKRTKYVRALMGSENCVNLVSPGHFLCHVPGCSSLVKLKHFNDLTFMIEHLKQHVITNSSSSSSSNKKNEPSSRTRFVKDKSCMVLIRRHNYFKVREANLVAQDLSTVIKDMETRKAESGLPYAVQEIMKNKLLVKEGLTFIGSSLLTRQKVVKEPRAQEQL